MRLSNHGKHRAFQERFPYYADKEKRWRVSKDDEIFITLQDHSVLIFDYKDEKHWSLMTIDEYVNKL